MMRLILVRHGQSMANLEGVFAGHYDVELSPLGHRQAEKTAEYISENYKVDKIYASDLKRAYATAQHIAEKLDMEIIPVPQMREIFAGEWEAMKFAELNVKYAKEYEVWKEDIGNSGCVGGETVKELSERISAELLRIAEENDGKTVVVATHATPIRVTQCKWQGMPLGEMKNTAWVSNASVTEAVYENGVFTPIKIGEDRHLGELITELPANV